MRFAKMVLACAVCLAFADLARAEIAIENIRICYGPLGPVRENLTIAAYDKIYFCFDVVGLASDGKEKTNVLFEFQVKGPDGGTLLEQKKEVQSEWLLGGGQSPAYFHVFWSDQSLEGEYTLIVRATDKNANKKANFERKFQFKKSGLAIISPTFSYDAEGKILAPLGGFTGQNLFTKFSLINFSKKDGKIDVDCSLTAVDEKGNKTKDLPITISMKESDPKKTEEYSQLYFNTSIGLNRPGLYKITIEVKDNVAGTTTSLTLPMKVTDYAP